MDTETKTKTLKTGISALIVGGVTIKAGQYLYSGAEQPSDNEPDKNTGYAFFDGKVLTLHNYEYSGTGLLSDGVSLGISVPAGELTIHMEGESTLTVDAITRGVGLYTAAGASVTIDGKGSLTISVQNGKNGNTGIGGDGKAQIKSGKLRISVGLTEYTIEHEKKIYAGDSYAVNIKNFIDKGARVSGNDKRGSKVNKNNPAQVVYDFPRRILWLPLCFGAVALIAAGVTIWALFFRSPVVLTPDYAPVMQDEHAEEIPDEVDTEKLEQPEGGGAIGVTYMLDVSVDRAGETIKLYFANPSRSNKDMVLQLVIQDEIVAQSGTLSPGNQLKALALLDGAAAKLAPGGYDGLMRVLAYEPGSGEKVILNTDIAVNVTVQ